MGGTAVKVVAAEALEIQVKLGEAAAMVTARRTDQWNLSKTDFQSRTGKRNCNPHLSSSRPGSHNRTPN